MQNTIRKTAASIIALTLVCGGLPTSTGGFTFFRPSVTANAEETTESTATLNEKTGVLTLSGNVTPRDVKKYADNESVMYVVAEEGTVLPEDCSYMFYGFYKTKSIDLSKADTSNVTNMKNMFAECHSLSSLNLTNFNTSKVTDMSGMFETCKSLTAIDLSNFDTSNVTDMGNMFSECYNLSSLDLSGFDTSKVTDMSFMFNSCSNLSALDLSGFDTSAVTNMSYMFGICYRLSVLDLSGFDTSKVTNMRYMFEGCNSLTTLDVSNFNTSNVTDMSAMFGLCGGLKYIDLSVFDTSKVTDMSDMFSRSEVLKTINVGSLWTTAAVEKDEGMFKDCKSLVGGNGTEYDSGKISSEYARIDEEGKPGYFTLKKRVNVPTVSLDEETGVLTLRGNVIKDDVKQFVFNDENVKYIVAEEGTVLPEDCSDMFSYFFYVRSIDLSKADTSNITIMKKMFAECHSLSSLNLTNFNTSKVTDINDVYSPSI